MLDLNIFAKSRPYLYHLTKATNIESIIKAGRLFSTNYIIDTAGPEYQHVKTERRPDHVQVDVDGTVYSIRDQKPLNPKLLERCLNGCTVQEYISHLNDHVFLWARIPGALSGHYSTYKHENPLILRFSTAQILELNDPPAFTHLNSGGLRATSHFPSTYNGVHYGGGAAPRGLDVFKSAADYDKIPSTVKEVTFYQECIIPKSFEIGSSPGGPWEEVN